MRLRGEKSLFLARRSVVILALLVAFVGVSVAQEPVTLRPGIVIDPGKNTIYVMTPDGIAAVDLTSGAKRWTTTEAAKPLALSGDLLITQVEPKSLTRVLELATLNTNQRGEVTVRSQAELPQTVKVAIGQTFDWAFETEARAYSNNAFVSWRFESREPLQGRRSKEEISQVGEIPARTESLSKAMEQTNTEGTFRVNLLTGDVAPANKNLFKDTMARFRMSSEEKGVGAPPTQYESGDRRHIMTSVRIADNNTWDKYRWTVFEKDSNKRVGEFRTHLSFAPFVVKGSLLIYETTPFVLEGKAEPAKLRGVNLATGQEAWSVEVRENTYRGPYPP